jgi:predicted negative regulator of RcsB-dependent stress response
VLLFFAERRDEALRLVEESVTSDPDPWVRAAARSVRMAFAENEGDLDGMRADVDAGVREWTALQDTWGLAAVLSARGQLRVMDGDLDGASADFEEAQRKLQALGTSSDDLLMHMRLADLRLRAGDPAGARGYLEAMRRSRSPGELAPMRDVLVAAMEASVVLAELEVGQDAVRATRDRLLAALRATGEPNPFQAHGSAVGYGALAALDLAAGDREAARRHVREGYRHAVRTNDLPILAVVGLAVAEVALASGHPLVAAEMAGATARLRGSDDPGSPFVRRVLAKGRRLLGDPAWDAAYARGRAMDRTDAIARIDPDLLGDPAPGAGDGVAVGAPRAVGGAVGAGQARRR